MVFKRDIIYPVFLECVNYTNNIFWQNIFEDLAYGKSPYGTYFYKNFIICSYKDKEFNYKIETDEPSVIYKDLYQLFTQKLGLLSNKEKIKNKLDFFKYENDLKKSSETWKTIRKKNIKDVLIERYVIDNKKKYNLTIKQGKYLLSLILTCIIFKIILPTDILYDNREITNIKGINFTDKHIIIKRDIIKDSINITDEQEYKKKTFSDKWVKFLINIEKSDKNNH